MPPLSIMIKPASSLCNMRCEYCFYHNVVSLRDVESYGVMTLDTAEGLIKKALKFANGESVAFAFQGGEPLLAGHDYFREFVKIVKNNNCLNSQIFYSLQTNGTLINDEWCELFKENNFLVGLSLDGDYVNNRFRLEQNGNNSFYKILTSAQKLKKYEVNFNVLTVLTGNCADNIDEIYRFFKSKNFKFLQFIPCLRPFGDKSESEMFMTNEQYASFLIKCFNYYVKDYVRGDYTSVRYFDNLVAIYLRRQPEQCGMCGRCSHQFVVEGNGNVYPCDFYCTDEWLLGNINNSDFNTLANCDKAISFLKESLSVPKECKECKFYPLCRSQGCKRQKQDRDYCNAYKSFFSACLPLFRVFNNEK